MTKIKPVQDSTQFNRSPLSLLLQAGLLYLVLLAAHGYIFGHQDLIEIQGYLNFLEDPTCYANDFYLQNITARVPNERWMFVEFLHFFNISTPWSFLISHFIVSMFLMTGMLKTAQELVRDEFFAFLAVFATVIVFYKINLGGNELYYNTLSSSLVAKSIGIWSFYFFLKKAPTTAVLLLIPATLIHPIAGVQLFLICSGIIVVTLIKTGVSSDKLRLYWSIPVYLLTAGLWLFFLEKQFSGGSLGNEGFFEIIRFRLAHHFIPSAFGLKNYIILLPIFLFAWNHFRKQNDTLFWFFNFAILGLVVYTLGVEVLHGSVFLSTQWFKTTIWLKFFSMIAISTGVADLLKKHFPTLKKSLFFLFALALGALTTYLYWKIPQRHPSSFDMPWRGDYNDEIAIAQLAKRLTPRDALFITPTYYTHLKYYGKRSTYVDYKAMVHHKSVLQEWYRRVKEIYQFREDQNSTQRLSGTPLRLPASPEGIERLKSLDITHMITDAPLTGYAKLLGQRGKYYLYEIDPGLKN